MPLGNCYSYQKHAGSFRQACLVPEKRTEAHNTHNTLPLFLFRVLQVNPGLPPFTHAVCATVVSNALDSLDSPFICCVQINKFDWLVFNAAWLGVMFAGVEIGLAISIGLSVVIVLYKTGFPHLAVLGRLPSTTVYR